MSGGARGAHYPFFLMNMDAKNNKKNVLLPPNGERRNPFFRTHGEYASKMQPSPLRGRTGVALLNKFPSMKPYTIPVIRTNDPRKWYVEFWYDIPENLRKPGKRHRQRFRKYGDINKLEGDERIRYAKQLRQDWEFLLEKLDYNPFGEEIEGLNELVVQENLSVQVSRKQTPVGRCLDLFIESRKVRSLESETVSTYRTTVKWFTEYLESAGLMHQPISKIKRIHVAEALTAAKESREWGPTTYNNELVNIGTIFKWLLREEYIDQNVIDGKIDKLKANKTMHKWYDRELATTVKKAILNAGEIAVYRACQFTYWIMIRSKKELMKLKVGDIDRELKRVRFSAELSKNGVECFRDYPPEFDAVLDEMGFDSLPKDWYLFGKNGVPGPDKAGQNTLSRKFKPIKDDLKLSDDYTIYSWKHTRVCHLMMLGVDGYEISHMARHRDLQSTEAYKKDYDFTLTKVYNKKDLTF